MEAQIAALEEEINILKGEIKSILQEVRTAILASENPFTGVAASLRAGASVGEERSEPRVVQLSTPPAGGQSAPAPAAIPASAAMAQAASGDMAPRDEEGQGYGPTAVSPAARGPQPPQGGPAYEPVNRAPRPSQDHYDGEERRLAAPDVRALAALLTWVEETRERLDERGYKVVLGLARYGELIDRQLEETLLEAAKTVGGKETEEHTSVNDSIVALRQLEAILTPGANIRLLSDYGIDTEESNGHYPSGKLRVGREVRPSRRQ